MHSYWALVRNSGGGYYRVVVQADNGYTAYQMLIAQYGRENLISESAAYIPE